MKAFFAIVLLTITATSSANAQKSPAGAEEFAARTRALALNTAIIQMGRDRLVGSGGECSIVEVAQMVGNPDLTEKFTEVYEITSPLLDTNAVRCYRIVSSLEEPPVHFVVAVNQKGCVFFLNGFDKNSWDDLVRDRVSIINSDEFVMDLARFYLATVEAEKFWGSTVIETADDIERCDVSIPDGKVLPVITRDASGFTRLLIHSCDPATDTFWRHEFRVGPTGDVRLESKKV